jgi:hypothetical protein
MSESMSVLIAYMSSCSSLKFCRLLNLANLGWRFSLERKTDTIYRFSPAKSNEKLDFVRWWHCDGTTKNGI